MSNEYGPPEAEQVQGWKAIAAVFDRTVRTVQRWERELGLPVHRFKTARGSTVYAFVAELRAWRKRADPLCLDAEPARERSGGPPDETDATAVRAVPGSAGRRPRDMFRIASAAVLILAMLTVAFQTMRRDAPAVPVKETRTNGAFLEAIDSAGAVVWRYDLGFRGQIVDLRKPWSSIRIGMAPTKSW